MINITLGRAFAIGIVSALAMGILIEGASAGEREEAERKAADVEHRRSVNNAALAAMIESGIDEKCAKRVIVLVASEKIPGMPVNY